MNLIKAFSKLIINLLCELKNFIIISEIEIQSIKHACRFEINTLATNISLMTILWRNVPIYKCMWFWDMVFSYFCRSVAGLSNCKKQWLKKVTWKDRVCTKREYALLHIYKPCFYFMRYFIFLILVDAPLAT